MNYCMRRQLEEEVITCCGVGWCERCWADHDVYYHTYPEEVE